MFSLATRQSVFDLLLLNIVKVTGQYSINCCSLPIHASLAMNGDDNPEED